jgi:hypothetical protein
MLHSIELPDLSAALPPSAEVEALLDEADRRILDFMCGQTGRLIHSFVPSDYRAVNAHLRWIVQQRLAAGGAFCEWGSGFGVVTMLAALHEFDACGIEVEAELVEHARLLAEDRNIPVQFAQGSLIPAGKNRLVRQSFDAMHLDIDSPAGYDELGMDVEDFDLFYVFPWPEEKALCDNLFDRCAADGALLLTYHGIEDFRLQRKVSKSSARKK